MSTPGRLIVYGAQWCADCRRTKRLLDQRGVSYQWVDLEQDDEARARVLALTGGRRVIPVVVFPDGGHLAEPSDAQLTDRLGVLLRRQEAAS